MSPLSVISGMSIRQVGAHTVDIRRAALAHIFYSECFLAPSATLTLPPTPSNQYIISSHYARMHIYRERVANREERLVKRVCAAVLVGVRAVCSAVRSAGLLLRKLKIFSCCVFLFVCVYTHMCRHAPAQDRVV